MSDVDEELAKVGLTANDLPPHLLEHVRETLAPKPTGGHLTHRPGLPDDIDELKARRKAIVKEVGGEPVEDLDAPREKREAAQAIRVLDREIAKREAQAAKADAGDDLSPRELAARLRRY